MPQLTKKILLIAISAALILVALYPYSPKKDYRISITDQVEINFDSVYNTLLNDTFYFPKVFGHMYLQFEEDDIGFEIRYIRRGLKFSYRLSQLNNFLSDSNYSCYRLSLDQIEAFEDYHDRHFGDSVDFGQQMECLTGLVQLYLGMPQVYTKYNGDRYLVIQYSFFDNSTGKKLRFDSFENFYILFDGTGYCNCQIISAYENFKSCEGLKLNYPIIFKMDKQTGQWQLRNTKAMHESDIKELGFKRVMFD